MIRHPVAAIASQIAGFRFNIAQKIFGKETVVSRGKNEIPERFRRRLKTTKRRGEPVRIGNPRTNDSVRAAGRSPRSSKKAPT
jgi:hypothetical protein